jgi:hypothetical protein
MRDWSKIGQWGSIKLLVAAGASTRKSVFRKDEARLDAIRVEEGENGRAEETHRDRAVTERGTTNVSN